MPFLSHGKKVILDSPSKWNIWFVPYFVFQAQKRGYIPVNKHSSLENGSFDWVDVFSYWKWWYSSIAMLVYQKRTPRVFLHFRLTSPSSPTAPGWQYIPGGDLHELARRCATEPGPEREAKVPARRTDGVEGCCFLGGWKIGTWITFNERFFLIGG